MDTLRELEVALTNASGDYSDKNNTIDTETLDIDYVKYMTEYRGVLNGKGQVTHQLFKEGGAINGIPS